MMEQQNYKHSETDQSGYATPVDDLEACDQQDKEEEEEQKIEIDDEDIL